MPSFFDISVAAFAIGMATNANVPANTPHAPQNAQVIVQQQAADAATPAPAPGDVAQADCVAKKTDANPVCAQNPAQ